jgi:hypothetical protein
VGEGDQQRVEGAYNGPSRGVGLCGLDEALNISLKKDSSLLSESISLRRVFDVFAALTRC